MFYFIFKMKIVFLLETIILMDSFKNKLDIKRFNSTNGLWNNMKLNSPWSVGYVTSLIQSKTFQNKEEWEQFYYDSGELRKQKISILDKDLKSKLNNELFYDNQKEISKLN